MNLIFRFSENAHLANPEEDVESSDSSYPVNPEANVSSIESGDRETRSEDCDDRTPQEVVIAAGEVLEGALVTDTENDGNYSNDACQDWNIMADENQVYVVFQNKNPFHVGI